MKISKNGTLKNKLSSFSSEIIKAVKDARKKDSNRQKSDNIFDYPGMAIGCEYGTIQECGRSHKCILNDKGNSNSNLDRADFNIRVERKLKVINPKLTKLPGKPEKDPITGQVLYFGTCAEDDAANKVLNRFDSTRTGNPQLSQLAFTKAIRPRTGSKKTNCPICKKVFS